MLSSCSSGVVHKETAYFTDLIWNRFNNIEQSFQIEDTEGLYDLYIHFEHNENYPTDHIAMNITLYYPNEGMRSRDYEFKLQDSNLKWLGKVKDKGFVLEFPVMTGVKFAEAGTNKVRIESKMTKFNLPGVIAVGFKVIQSKQ